MRLVQLQRGSIRRVARVDEPSLRLLTDTESVLALANDAIRLRMSLTALVERRRTSEEIEYDSVHAGSSSWRLLVPIDHPEPARCLVSGTGLTHYGSTDDVKLEDGDVMTIQFAGFGRPLRNVVRMASPVSAPIAVSSIE